MATTSIERGGSDARMLLGASLGVAPHLVLAALMLLSYATATSHEGRATSSLPALVEVFLVPGVLLYAIRRCFAAATRDRAVGLLGGTVLGALVVAAAVSFVERG
jgi:hypothetical protein